MLCELTFSREDKFGGKYFKFETGSRDLQKLFNIAEELAPGGKHGWMSEYNGRTTLKSKYKDFVSRSPILYDVYIMKYTYNGVVGTWAQLQENNP
jgi:hypothetical protein